MTTPLARKIRETIDSEGPMGFDRFMALALYDEQEGYYSAGKVMIGDDEGDFVTAPHLSPFFGGCLANLVEKIDVALGEPEVFHLVEGGPGEGLLAVTILDLLESRNRGLYDRLRYVADEVSPALKARQLEVLASHADKFADAPPQGYQGLYLSNELVDALPCRLVDIADGVVREVFVVNTPEGFAMATGEQPSQELADLLIDEGLDLSGNWRMEVCPGAQNWLERSASPLGRGLHVTIDYGDAARRLYGPHRPDGTLRGFSGGRFTDDPLARPGEVDITCSVNFTALSRYAQKLGLEPKELMDQRDFLFALGVAGEFSKLDAQTDDFADSARLRQEMSGLLMPGTGMGESFKALVLAKGIGIEQLDLSPEAGLDGLF